MTLFPGLPLAHPESIVLMGFGVSRPDEPQKELVESTKGARWVVGHLRYLLDF